MTRSPNDRARLRVWIDIENPPQVQYLMPMRDAFLQAGAEVVVTVRDTGFALQLIRNRGIRFEAVGTSAGRGRLVKGLATWHRSGQLMQILREQGKPDLLFSPARSAHLAAWRLRIPGFSFSDYEYANLSLARLTRPFFFYPDVVDPEFLVKRGVRRELLIPFRGLKEDVSFNDVDLDAVEPHSFPIETQDAVKVLFRPPAEQSHYFTEGSLDMTLAALADLATRPNVLVIYSPREPSQIEYLRKVEWQRQPLVLEQPVPFVPLLKAVDAVISAGGTMTREAAYIGVPAYSVYQGKIPAVDRHLEKVGRLTIVESPEAFRALTFQQGQRQPPLASNPHLAHELAAAVLRSVS